MLLYANLLTDDVSFPMICLKAPGARGAVQICFLTSLKNMLPHKLNRFELHTSYCSLLFKCIIDFTFHDLSHVASGCSYLLFNSYLSNTHTFVALSCELDNKGTLVGSTTNKLEGKLGLFFVLYENTSVKTF